jgi:hypothetical protein|tara:strand:- start:340 stop:528 length:189 start_codon:yes stop_codon:yes gene_type:complete
MFLFIFLFINSIFFSKKIIPKVNFEVGINEKILKVNDTKKEQKNKDAALIPLKDIPKNKPLW